MIDELMDSVDVARHNGGTEIVMHRSSAGGDRRDETR
jgi:hypothetical protein